MKIKASVVYLNLEGGFWGLVDDQGKKWLPVNMPASLKVDGKKIDCSIKELNDVVTSFQWGTPVEIVSF